MMKRFGIVAALAVLLCGCEQVPSVGGSKPKKLVVGKVDTAQVLQSDPDYMSMAQEYLKEQTVLQAMIQQRAKAAGKDRAELDKLRKEFTEKRVELNKKWAGKTGEFLTSRHGKMNKIVEEICKDKGIDIVVIDSKQYTTVEWGAVDITQDVLLKTAGGGAPLNSAAPSGTATP